MRRRPVLTLAATAVGLVALAAPSLAQLPDTGGLELAGSAADDAPSCAEPAEMTFEQGYIDQARAGGEPIVATHPNGNLLWGSHAGTTHFYSPAANDETSAAFVENYQGQTYQYVDKGDGWEFVPREPISTLDPLSGLPNTGFSDPEFAIDLAGNVFISEINLVNIAISKSTDGGESYTLQNPIPISLTDRQWMEADEEDVLWFVGNTFGGGSTTAGEPVTGSTAHRLYKSTDGGVTFSPGQDMGGQQSSDIKIDRTDGRLYELHSEGSQLTMWVAPDAREQTPPDVEFEKHVIADRYDRKTSIGPTFDIAPNGDLYVVWDDDGGAGREPGIYYTYSTDRGVSWAETIKLDDGTGTAFWPWIAAGSEGAVAVWLQHEDVAPGNAPQQAEGAWHVMAAQTLSPTGCEVTTADGESAHAPPRFRVQQASDEPVHEGTICTGGTVCQAQAIDRRLGDYFANAIDRDGNVYISVSDTRQGGAVSLPLEIRQTGGDSVGDPYAEGPLAALAAESDAAEAAAGQGAGAPAHAGAGLGLLDRVILARAR